MRHSKKLTNRIVEAAGPGRHSDGGGLYLMVRSPQTRFWSLRYRVAGKPREMGLGPAGGGDGAMSLAEARAKAAELLQQADAGSDPLAERARSKNVHAQFLDHQAAIEGAQQVWASLTPEQRAAASPGGEAEGEAMLTGDVSVMAQHAAASLGVDIDAPNVFLDLCRRTGSPILFLIALFHWPAHLPLAKELRRFLELALSDFVAAAEDYSETAASPKEVNESLLRSLGLLYAPGQTAAVTAYRQDMRAAAAEHVFQRHLAALGAKDKKNALHLTAQELGIPQPTLEQWLRDVRSFQCGD